MVDNEKVRIMTRIAIYEKNNEHEGLALAKFFREDDIKYNLLKTLVTSTFCFWTFVVASVLLNFEKYLSEFGSANYFKLVGKLMMNYCIFLLIFEVIAFAAYSYRYYKAKPGLIEYNGNLRRLIEYYERLETTDTKKYKVSSSIGGDIDDLDMSTFRRDKGEKDNERSYKDQK